jgi:hypothetical protein
MQAPNISLTAFGEGHTLVAFTLRIPTQDVQPYLDNLAALGVAFNVVAKRRHSHKRRPRAARKACDTCSQTVKNCICFFDADGVPHPCPTEVSAAPVALDTAMEEGELVEYTALAEDGDLVEYTEDGELVEDPPLTK